MDLIGSHLRRLSSPTCDTLILSSSLILLSQDICPYSHLVSISACIMSVYFLPHRSFSTRDSDAAHLRILPLCTVAFHNRYVTAFPFLQIYANSTECIHAPLGITQVRKISFKECPQVLRERLVENSVSCAAHQPCLEHQVVL